MITISVQLRNGSASTDMSSETWRKLPKFKQDEIVEELISSAKGKLKAHIVVSEDKDKTL